jgi:hypothetical protein
MIIKRPIAFAPAHLINGKCRYNVYFYFAKRIERQGIQRRVPVEFENVQSVNAILQIGTP